MTVSTGGQTYPCWKCGGAILNGCTHYCTATALPAKTLIFGDTLTQPAQRPWTDYSATELAEAKAKGYGAAGMELVRRADECAEARAEVERLREVLRRIWEAEWDDPNETCGVAAAREMAALALHTDVPEENG